MDLVEIISPSGKHTETLNPNSRRFKMLLHVGYRIVRPEPEIVEDRPTGDESDDTEEETARSETG